MKKLIYYSLAVAALLSCSGTKNNDPWGSVEVDPNAKRGTVVKDATVKSLKRGETMKYSVWPSKGAEGHWRHFQVGLFIWKNI